MSPCRRWFLATAAFLCVWSTNVNSAHAEETNTSLDVVPQDAGFYSSSLRIRERAEEFYNSRAFTQLRMLPTVQMGLAFLNQQYQQPQLAPVRKFLRSKDGKELTALLEDAVSQECFMYGDVGLIELVGLIGTIQQQSQFAQFQGLLEHGPQGQGPEQGPQVDAIVAAALAQSDKLRIHPFVLGFKLADPRRGIAHLDKLQELLSGALPGGPAERPFIQREKIGTGDYVSLNVDGSMLPWDRIEESVNEEMFEKLSPLFDHIAKETLSIAVGVTGNWLIVTVSSDTKHLAKLGGPQPLAQHTAMQKILPHLQQRISALTFVSPSVFELQSRNTTAQIDQMRKLVEMMVEKVQFSAETKDDIARDLEKLKVPVAACQGVVGCTFQTDRGTESYAYTLQDQVEQTGTPLPILQHVGRPLAFSAARSVMKPGEYDQVVAALPRIRGYIEEGIKNSGAEDAAEHLQQFQHGIGLAEPLLKRLDQTLRTNLIPALMDGQLAVILDTKSASTQWHQDLPPSKTPLPMLELGLVIGISDAEKARKAGQELWTLTQDALNLIHAEAPDDTPAIDLPEPEALTVSSGTLQGWLLPEQAGLDRQFTPCLGLGDQVAVFSTSPGLAERVLKGAPFEFEGPLASHSRTMLTASHVEMPALLNAIEAWVDFGFAAAAAQQGAEDDNLAVAMVRGQIGTVLDFFRCWKATGAVTYVEDGAVVTHVESRWEDLPE